MVPESAVPSAVELPRSSGPAATRVVPVCEFAPEIARLPEPIFDRLTDPVVLRMEQAKVD